MNTCNKWMNLYNCSPKKAILVISYGGPESVADVELFLDRVLQGRAIPPARRDMVAKRYIDRGGISPLPAECRQLLSHLDSLITSHSPLLAPKIYWGNLHSTPRLEETVQEIVAAGVTYLRVVVTSPVGSETACHRYLLRLESALPPTIAWSKMPVLGLHPLYQMAIAQRITTLLHSNEDDSHLLLFTAHAIPQAEAQLSKYEEQLRRQSEGVIRCLDQLRADIVPPKKFPPAHWAIAYQSRSGSPDEPWTVPTPQQAIDRFVTDFQINRVIVVPLGFFFENMETIFDLDEELQSYCISKKLKYHRAVAVGATLEVARIIADWAVSGETTGCPAGNQQCNLGCCDL